MAEQAKQTGAVAEQMAKNCPQIKIAYALRGMPFR
jgi:hypothetical protein